MRPLVWRALGLHIQFVEIRGADDLGRAFAALGGERVDALLVPGDTLLFTERQRVTALAREHRLPGIYSLREFTEAGGLMSYGSIIRDLGYRGAGQADKVLKGAKPADVPIDQATTFELVINLKTAKAMGLTMPPSLLLRADRVIE